MIDPSRHCAYVMKTESPQDVNRIPDADRQAERERDRERDREKKRKGEEKKK